MMFSPGCNCCCDPATTLVHFTITNTCTGAAVSGATVTLLDAGGSTVGTGTTDGSGHCDIGVSATGTYHATVTKSGFCDGSASGIVVSVCAHTVNQSVSIYPTTMTVHVTGCCSLALQGATVTGPSDSATTDSSGNATITVPCAGTFTVSVTKTRFNNYTSSTITAQTVGACSLTVSMTAASGYICIGGCADPIKDTLTLTGVGGTTGTTTYSAGKYTWVINYSFAGNAGCTLPVACPAGTIPVTYVWTVDCGTSGWSASYPCTNTGSPITNCCPDGSGLSATFFPVSNLVTVCPPTFSVSVDLGLTCMIAGTTTITATE